MLRGAVACCNPSLEIYRNCGKLLKSKNQNISKAVAQWLKSVEQAGKEMAAGESISDSTMAALNQPLMPVEDYVAYLGMG